MITIDMVQCVGAMASSAAASYDGVRFDGRRLREVGIPDNTTSDV